ncbi:MAG: hypothetical protein RL325_643 [Planctomycetota bacterium]
MRRAALGACLLAGMLGAAEAPPLRLTQRNIEALAAKAASSGELESYFEELRSALERELDGGRSKGALRFASGEHGRAALLQWKLLSALGPSGRADPANAELLSWLLADGDALGLFLGSGDPAGGKWDEAARILARTARDETHREGLPLRVAVATALVFAEPVRSMADGSDIDPVARADSFLAWDAKGELFPSFRDLSAWELRYVVGSWSTDADLEWARANIKPDLKRRDKVGDAAHMLAYNLTNKNGVSVQEGRKFYDDKPMTLAVMLEYGGVCGAISRFGSSMSQAFGVPAMPVGQPGHCAFLWQKEPHQWSVNNDVSGWAESGQHDGIHIPWGRSAWFVPLMQDAQRDRERFATAEALLAAASLCGEASWGAFAAEACKECPQHYAAWNLRLAAARGSKAAKPSRDGAREMPKELASAFARHPVAYAQLANMLPLPPGGGANSDEERRLRACAETIAGFARGGADAGLCSWAMRVVLEESARRLLEGADEPAGLALVRGETAPSPAGRLVEVRMLMGLALESVDLLDVAPDGPAHEAWKGALARLVRGIAASPELREAGMREIERRIAGLAGQGRADHARWLADRVVDAAKESKDAAFESRAAALRKGLG